MALRHFTVTIPAGGGPINLGTELDLAQDDVAYIFLSFELSTGTKVFIGGDSTVSSTNYAGSCTTSKVYEPHGGAMRLGDIWVTGTANDVLQIGAVAL